MPVALKLDEDLSPLVADPLLRRGHDVASVVEQGWTGCSDTELWSRMGPEGRMLLTADKGFADIRVYPPGSHAGIIVLRSDRESIVEYARLVETLVNTQPLEKLAGCLTVVSSAGVRVRRPERPESSLDTS